jgi:hypothetical protein
MGGPPAWGLGVGVTTHHHKKLARYETSQEASTWMDFLDKRPKRKKIQMRFGAWNVRSTYRAGSLRAVAEEISKYMLDFVQVQEVRWAGGGTEPVDEYTFFYRKGNENHEIGTCSFVHKRIISAVKRVEFVSDGTSYIVLRGGQCDIIILNVHSPTEDKIDDMKGRVYEEVKHVFNKFPKHHIKILL